MYAIIETGGKQYKIKENQIINIEKTKTNNNKYIKLKKILMFSDENNKIIIGNPYIKNIIIIAKIIKKIKTKKIHILKFKRRKNYKRKIGHRQNLIKIKIKKINIIKNIKE